MRICLEQLQVAYWTAFHAVLKDLNLDDSLPLARVPDPDQDASHNPDCGPKTLRE